MTHPLGALLERAARGIYPPADGGFDVLPAPPGRADVMLAFTGHFVLAADIDAEEIRARVPPGDFSIPMSTAFLAWLGERLGSAAATHDALLVALGTGAGAPAWLQPIDASTHPRVERASRYRADARVWSADGGAGVVIVGRGICGRWELGFEVEPGARAHGLGRRIVAAARGLVPEGAALWAQVAPGNAASLRTVIAGGFAPIGAEVLFPRAHPAPV